MRSVIITMLNLTLFSRARKSRCNKSNAQSDGKSMIFQQGWIIKMHFKQSICQIKETVLLNILSIVSHDSELLWKSLKFLKRAMKINLIVSISAIHKSRLLCTKLMFFLCILHAVVFPWEALIRWLTGIPKSRHLRSSPC